MQACCSCGLPSSGAQQKSSSEEQKSAKSKSSGGQSEGIKVHGHWSIDIRNPDGSLASHVEFENSLVDNGELLTSLLNGGAAPSAYSIIVQGTVGSTNSPCGGASPCTALDVPKSIVRNSTGGPIFQLQATITAIQNGTIGQVKTTYPGSGGAQVFFTAATLLPADQKAVVSGQIIQVTVQISFS